MESIGLNVYGLAVTALLFSLGIVGVFELSFGGSNLGRAERLSVDLVRGLLAACWIVHSLADPVDQAAQTKKQVSPTILQPSDNLIMVRRPSVCA